MNFLDLKLPFGTVLQVQPEGADTRQWLPAKLIGALPEKALLITVPRQGGKPVRLRPGQKLTCRAMVANGVGLFAAQVEHIAHQPFAYVHLSYPAAATFKEIRGATRVEVNLPVQVVSLSEMGDAPTIDGLAVDISTSGARIALREPVGAVGDELAISGVVNVGSLRREVTVRAVIRARIERSTREHLREYPAVYGIEFVERDSNDLLALYGYVFSEMVAQVAPAKE